MKKLRSLHELINIVIKILLYEIVIMLSRYIRYYGKPYIVYDSFYIMVIAILSLICTCIDA